MTSQKGIVSAPTYAKGRASAKALSAAPDGLLGPAEFGKLACAQGRLACGKEFIELRRRDIGRAQHSVRLPAMMSLVLEQMQQQPVHPLVLNMIAAVDVDDMIETGRVQMLDDGNQSPVHLGLRLAKQDRGLAGLLVGP